MTMTLTIRGAAFLAAGMLAMGSAQAITTSYSGLDGIWTTVASWSAGLPVAGDVASIMNEKFMTTFHGQTVGSINAAGKKFYLHDSGTLTFDNLGATASLSVGPSNIGHPDHTTLLAFTDDLNLTVSNNRLAELYATIQGPGTLKLLGTATSGLGARASSVIDAGLVDLSGFGYVTFHAGAATLNGQTVSTGSTCYFNAAASSSYSGVNGSNLQMAEPYALFRSNTGETLVIGSWKVGSVDVPKGTYNAGSGVVEGVDMAVVFALSNISLTVTEAPARAFMILLR